MVDTVENQMFAEWAADKLGGYDKLEEVARKDVNRLHNMGTEYLQGNYSNNPHIPVSREDLQATYKNNSATIDRENPVERNLDRTEGLAAQNHVRIDRSIDNSPQEQVIVNTRAIDEDYSDIRSKRERAYEIRNAKIMKQKEAEYREKMGWAQKGTADKMGEDFIKNTQ